jgi:transposase
MQFVTKIDCSATMTSLGVSIRRNSQSAPACRAGRLFEELRGRGYDGAHDSVHRFVKAWRVERARVPVQAFVPMSFAPGEAYQFDWSHETITLQGLPLVIKAAHMKLSHSRTPLVRVYFRETQELVFDAHDKAFAFYGGVCRRGIYDNMKTAVETTRSGPGIRSSRSGRSGRYSKRNGQA